MKYLSPVSIMMDPKAEQITTDLQISVTKPSFLLIFLLFYSPPNLKKRLVFGLRRLVETPEQLRLFSVIILVSITTFSRWLLVSQKKKKNNTFSFQRSIYFWPARGETN